MALNSHKNKVFPLREADQAIRKKYIKKQKLNRITEVQKIKMCRVWSTDSNGRKYTQSSRDGETISLGLMMNRQECRSNQASCGHLEESPIRVPASEEPEYPTVSFLGNPFPIIVTWSPFLDEVSLRLASCSQENLIHITFNTWDSAQLWMCQVLRGVYPQL